MKTSSLHRYPGSSTTSRNPKDLSIAIAWPPVKVGVFWGSVFGLFLVYIAIYVNEIPSLVEHSRLQQFADGMHNTH